MTTPTTTEIPFPCEHTLSPEQIQTNFRRFEITGSADSFHGFRILLPKNLKPLEAASLSNTWVTRFGISLVFRASSSIDSATSVSVWLSKMGRDMDPDDWLNILLAEAGETLLTGRTERSATGRLPDRLSRVQKIGRGFLRRSRAVKDGQRIWLVTATAPEGEGYDRLAESLFVALSSFHLSDPEGAHCAEQLLEYRGSEFQFQYPASWLIRPSQSASDDKLELTVANRSDGKLAGVLAFHARFGAGREAARDLLRDHVQRMTQRGITVTGAPFLDVLTSEQGGVIRQCPLTGFYQGVAMDLPAVTWHKNGTAVLLALISPAKDAAHEWWAIHRRAFDVALTTFSWR